MIIETMAPPMQARSAADRIDGICVDQEMMFSNARGIYRKGIEKRQRKLLDKIDFIKPFLREGEKVILVTTGCSPMSVVEQLISGGFIFQLKRALFVFTDLRIFHIPATSRYGYRGSVCCFDYSDCEYVRIRARALQVKYHSGKSETFYRIDSKELSKLKKLFKDTPLPERQPHSLAKTSLCPSCTAPLKTNVFECTSCGQEFKDPKTNLLRSIFIPGGGYFYTNHYELGVLDAVLELFLTIMVVAGVVELFQNPTYIYDWITWVIVLVIEKALSIYVTARCISEFIPIKRRQ